VRQADERPSLGDVGAIFVQAHLDDVALSCGGSVLALGHRHPLVLTVFAAGPRPGQTLTPLARRLVAPYEELGLDYEATRLAEDDAAVALLGARSLRLALPDAPFRTDAYDAPERLRGPVDPTDRAVIEDGAAQLIDAWRRTPRATMFLPLAVGGHVDHVLLHEMGGPLPSGGAEVEY
jgi:LmbE family N-acetylglucosaminyl deacetylase